MKPADRQWLVAGAAWVTALFPARVAAWLLTLYATHGGTLAAALHVASSSLWWVLAYIAIGVLYLRVPALRILVSLVALTWAVTGFLKMPSYIHNLSTLNLWHNVLAESVWETCGCAVLACMAAWDLLASP